MRKKTKFKSRLLDVFMVVACLSVAGYFAYTFWKDLNSSAKRTDKEVIAIITFKNRIAQRKFDDRVVWERIDKSTPLYNGDLVRTADLAEAVITFNDNSQINLFENTMIQIYYSDTDGIKINVDDGNLQLDTSDTGKVAMKFDDGSVVSVNSGTSLAAKSQAKAVEVKNGTASVKTEKGHSTELSSGETVAVQSDGEIKKKPVTVTSIPSEMRVLNVEGESLPVKLEWNLAKNVVKEELPVIVQTSKTKDFKKIIEEKVVDKTDESLLNVSDGVVYWRVFPKGFEDEASVGKISVEKTSPVRIVSPVSSSEFTYQNKSPAINFQWSGADYAEKFMISVSASKDMSNPVFTTVTENRSVQVDKLGKGKWWWQVIPYYSMNSIGYAGESTVSSFTITRDITVHPPVLVVPNDHSLVSYKDNPSVNLIWKSDIKDASYQVFVATDSDFKNIIYYNQTNATRLSANIPEAAAKQNNEIYWKVVRKSNNATDLKPESVVNTFTLQKYVPEKSKLLYPPENFSAELNKLTSTQFLWKLSDDDKNKNSVIQVSSSKNFNSLQFERTVQKTVFENMFLPVGEWWWRIGTVQSDGTKTTFTEPRRLVVLAELQSPRFKGIKDGYQFVVSKNNPVELSWTNVTGADYYNVRIFNAVNQLVAENPDAKGTSAKFVLTDDFYTCRIQAVAEQNDDSPLRTGPVKSIDFSVRYPSPIVATYPSASQRFDGLTALRKSIPFTWKEGIDKAESYEFVLKKRQMDGSFKVVQTYKTTKPSYSIERLSAGSYSYQILAKTKTGIPLDSAPVSFTVTSVSSLPSPQLVSPASNFVMDSNYLRSNRNINFEWKPVAGATDYTLDIYRKEKNGKLTSIYQEKNIKGNKIKFKELSVLDVGEFTWSITAFCYAKDGYEEQRSTTTNSNFKIKFDTPSKIETVKPGKMYGE